MAAFSCGRTSDPPDAFSGEWRILICDKSLPSRTSVLNALRASGAAVERIDDLSTSDELQSSSRCNTALVAAGETQPDRKSNLVLIQHLHEKGVQVIAYEDGAGAWPLALRCRYLLTGCSALLDSSADDFSIEVERALQRIARSAEATCEHDRQIKETMAAHGVVGESRAMFAVIASVLRIGELSDLPVLITGESGTGKELLARAIHARDPKRSAGPFIALNCSTIPDPLAETELFGHRRGAFTGADRDRKGLFRAAHGGVLFLDEIAELGSGIQVKLLRVLQDNRVLAIGDEHDAPVSVRVIAATNGNLREMVDQRTFRSDLFHRLNVLSIQIPPVRERRDDIRPLVEHFIRKHHALNAAASRSVSSDFIEALDSLELPGNARQIENLVRSALVHNDGTRPLGLSDLPAEIWEQLADEASAGEPAVPIDASIGLLEANGWSLARTLQACERSFLQAALRLSDGNQSKTARLLGITPRCIYNKLRRHHLF